VGDLHALSVTAACLEFGLNDSKVNFKTIHGYVPKVIGTPFRAQVIFLLALPASVSVTVTEYFFWNVFQTFKMSTVVSC